MNEGDLVFYRQRTYKVIVVKEQLFFIRDIKNFTRSHWVRKELVMPLSSSGVKVDTTV